MDFETWRGHLEEVGVNGDRLREGYVLRDSSGRSIQGIFFNKSWSGRLFLHIHGPTAYFIDPNLWHYVPDSEIRVNRDKGMPNIFPCPGKEREALTSLLQPHSRR